MVQFLDADHHYDHKLEDLILCNVHTDDDDEEEEEDDDVPIMSLSSSRDEPSTYENAIDHLRTECMEMQEIDELAEKGQPGLLHLPGDLVTQ
jgi:hypothetical protein